MTSFDISETLAPTSDQLDAIELVAGPRTFTVESVVAGSDEQPVQVKLAGFPRVWRPSKGMRRVLAAGWGVQASGWTGRKVTLYYDPAVTFGKDRTGGTRISHMTDLPGNRPLSVPLLISRGKSAMFTVQPLADAPAPAQQAKAPAGIDAQLKSIHAGLTALGITNRDAAMAAISQVIDREITSPTDLSASEATRVLDWIKFEQEKDAEQTIPEPEL
jgi:hypothetical protein